MSIQEQKITEEAIAESGVQSQPDKLTGTAAQNKKVFDNLVTAVVRNRFNALLDELTGAAAAGQLGIATIPGFSADNIQTALEQIVQAMQDVTQGSVTDGSITLAKLAAEVTAVALGGAAAVHTRCWRYCLRHAGCIAHPGAGRHEARRGKRRHGAARRGGRHVGKARGARGALDAPCAGRGDDAEDRRRSGHGG